MNPITKSGIYYDESGQLILVTQGLGGYTLVAHKKILFRLYLDVTAFSCITVLATITYKIFGVTLKKSIVIPTASLLIDTTGPLAPSVGILFNGDVFPFPSSAVRYEIDFHVHGNGSTVPHFRISELVFLAHGRLRLLIHNLMGKAPWGTQITPTFAWLIDVFTSLERLSAMLPIRDGIKFGLTHTDVGLCYIYGGNIDTWPAICPSGNPPPCTSSEMVKLNLAETEQINAGGGVHIDATVSYRMRDPVLPGPGGEGVGGKAISYDSPPGKGLALVVGGNRSGKEFTAPIMAQEIGHLFGLEPKESPHFEDPLDGLHSKDPGHFDPFAFDFWLLKPYVPPPGGFVGDVMNNFGGGLGQGRDMVLYNAFDWEHLRQRLVRLPGVARSIASEERPSREEQDQIVASVNEKYAGMPTINLANPEQALPGKPGFTWHWTSRGFQPVARAGERKGGPGVDPGVEGIRSWLDDLGVKEVYAAVGDRTLGVVINPKADDYIHRKQPDVFDWAGQP